ERLADRTRLPRRARRSIHAPTRRQPGVRVPGADSPGPRALAPLTGRDEVWKRLVGRFYVEAHAGVRDRNHADDLPRLLHPVDAWDGDAVADCIRVAIRLVLALCDNDLVAFLIDGDEGVLQHDSECDRDMLRRLASRGQRRRALRRRRRG